MLTDEEIRKNAEVKETYRKMHTFQTVDFVRQKVLYCIVLICYVVNWVSWF